MAELELRYFAGEPIPFPPMNGEDALEWGRERTAGLTRHASPALQKAINTIIDTVLIAGDGKVYREALATIMRLFSVECALSDDGRDVMNERFRALLEDIELAHRCAERG